MDNKRSYACYIEGCESRACAKDLCSAHYARQRKGTNMSAPIRRQEKGRKCEIAKCLSPHYGLSMCKKHYRRARGPLRKQELVELCGNYCQDCKESFALQAYDFHHRIPEDKSFTVGEGIVNVSKKKLIQEIKKCDLLCSNCHRLRHINTNNVDTPTDAPTEHIYGVQLCSAIACTRQVRTRNLCNAHYLRNLKNKDMSTPIRVMDSSRICKIQGCSKPYDSMGLCASHRITERRRRKKEELVKACGNSCQDCGKTYPPEVYDFHHRDPKKKDLAMGSEMSKQPLSVLLTEAEKCDMLCSNCHRIRHITEQEMPA